MAENLRVHSHSLGDIAGTSNGKPTTKEFTSEEKASSYISSNGLVEVWRERGAASVEVHCMVGYSKLVLREKGAAGGQVEFSSWPDLADYMEAEDYVFADGCEPCGSLADFVSEADVAAVCWRDAYTDEWLGLYAIRRPR